MKTLISMTDFVLSEIKEPYTDSERLRVITNYAAFLKQPLKLWMFVPCDEDGNVLRDPRPMSAFDEINEFEDRLDEYIEAKEKVLFEGFHSIGDKEIELLNSDNWISFIEKSIDFTNEFGHDTQIYRIEDLIELELKLTPTALKQIGL